MKKVRTLTDPAGLWNRASLPYRLEWLLNSKVKQHKLASVLKMKWEELPFNVQVAIGAFR